MSCSITRLMLYRVPGTEMSLAKLYGAFQPRTHYIVAYAMREFIKELANANLSNAAALPTSS